MKPTFVEIIPGLPTEMWGYNGLVPGPTFRIQQGRKTWSARSTTCRPSTRC